MYLYNNGFNILCTHLNFFEMNVMNIKYPKKLLEHYNKCFSLLKRILKILEIYLKVHMFKFKKNQT
jgi:hypothetical protein